jgi:hypothetical protein
MNTDFNLTKLPPDGKIFVGLFTFLMLAVFLWAGTLAVIESGIFGSDEEEQSALEQYDYQTDMETIMADSMAVTAPDWSQGGQEEPINEEDLNKFNGGGESAWDIFEENLKLSHVHLNGHTALYFALGVVFFFSTASPKTKTIVYWIFGVSIFLHAAGLAGLDSCIFGVIAVYVGAIPLLGSILYMSLRIFGDLGKKK